MMPDQPYYCDACQGAHMPTFRRCKRRSLTEMVADLNEAEPARAIDLQEGGDHYKAMRIQPFEYIHANGIPFAEGCVIKYVSRWRAKGGVEDLKKARHFLDLLIEAESKA